MKHFLVFAFGFVLSSCMSAMPAGGAVDRTELTEALTRYGRSETLLIGELISARMGPTGMSSPPVHTATLKVRVGMLPKI